MERFVKEQLWSKSQKADIMRASKVLAQRLARDESGGEVIEYAIVAGLISVAAIAVIASFGTKVLARWNSVNSSL